MKPLGGAILLGMALVFSAARADAFDPIQPVAPDRPVPMMINLAGLADWGEQQPLIDRMKIARPWIGHLPGQWGGVDATELEASGVLDADGWPTYVPDTLTSIATLVMVDLTKNAVSLAGRYVLEFDGDGIIEVAGRVSNVRYGPNQVRFDFTPGWGGVEVKIQRTDRKKTGDYIRNITIMREDRRDAYRAGAVFNPDFLEALHGFQGLRFMDWMSTNNATQSTWHDRPRLTDYTYLRHGAPLELILRLANETRANPWLTLPHLGDDAYFQAAAERVSADLAPGLTAYVELSNEVWNWQFDQAFWAQAEAQARWGVENQWLQFYGMRAAQMAQIWRRVFSDAPERLITVISSQTGWLGLEHQALNAPLWQAENPANPAPFEVFDAYAITGYFGGHLGQPAQADRVRAWLTDSLAQATAAAQAKGLTGAALDAEIARTRYDHAFAIAGAELLDGRISGDPQDSVADFLNRFLPYHADIARDHNLDLLMYEGGTHVVPAPELHDDAELDAFFQALNYSEEMGALYTHLMSGWAAQTDAPFGHFNDIAPPLIWGSWGNLRFLGDENPRWDAIQRFRKGDRS